MQAAEAERQARFKGLREAERPIVANLRAVGVDVIPVRDLVNTSEPYPLPLPVLMEHTEPGGYPKRVMESLDRALAARATEYQLEDLIELLSFEDRGQSRIYFIQPILKLKGDRARAVVDSLRGGPVFGEEATALMKRRRK